MMVSTEVLAQNTIVALEGAIKQLEAYRMRCVYAGDLGREQAVVEIIRQLRINSWAMSGMLNAELVATFDDVYSRFSVRSDDPDLSGGEDELDPLTPSETESQWWGNGINYGF